MAAPLISLRFRNQAAWRTWLVKHHDSSPGVWLLFYKRHTGRSTISYALALEEALCFGWIDSILKRVDDESYLRKFTPRTNPEKWSELNLSHMRRLISAGKVTEAGLRVLGVPLNAARSAETGPAKVKSPAIPPAALLSAISGNPEAESFWQQLAPGCRNRYVGWILNAKQEQTRLRRIAEVVRFLAEKKKSVLK